MALYQEDALAKQMYEILQKDSAGISASYKYTQAHEKEFRAYDVETLVCDDYFLGLKDTIFPKHLEDIIELWEERKKRPVNLALLEQSIGSGKSFTASVLTWLQWFEVSTYYNPQKAFGLADDSTIAFMTMSRTESQARRVIFSDVFKRFQTPFNMDYFPPNPRFSKEIQIAQNNTVIYAGTSSELSALGYNLFAAVIDEANFLEVIEGSRKSEGAVYDACITGDTILKVGNKLVILDDIKNKKNFNVSSLNLNTGEVEESIVEKVKESGIRSILKLNFDNGKSIEVTDDQLILVNQYGKYIWKEAKDLTYQDNIVEV